ncbi:hypothetical protein, partial [Actinoplanes siamensis]
AAATTAPAAGDASRELAAAAAKLTNSTGKIHMTMIGGMTGDGSFDTPKRAVDMTMTMAGLGDVSVRQIGTDLYMKFGGSAAKAYGNGKWMHVDASKMPATSSLSLEKNDPRNSAKMLAEATEVKETSAGRYAGTIDISKSPTVTAEMLKALAGKSTQVPFTAEVKDGYLSKMSLDMDSVVKGAGSVDATYSDFGAKVEVAKPARSETVEMPESALKSLGG